MALLAALLAYSPALLRYGFPSVYSDARGTHGHHVLLAGYNWLQVLGLIQTLMLVIVLAIRASHAEVRRTAIADLHIRFALLVAVLWSILFLLLPDEPEYLLPTIPFIMIVVDRVATRRQFMILVLSLLSFHVIQLDALGGESGRREVAPRIRAGATIDDIQDRRFKLSTRKAVTNFRPEGPTVLMFGDAWIPTANPLWEFSTELRMYHRIGRPLYISSRILDDRRLADLHKRGFRLVVWRGAKAEYYRTGNERLLEQYAEVIDDLQSFLGSEVSGRFISVR